MVLVAWRTIDTAKTAKVGPVPYLALWPLGLGLAIAGAGTLAAAAVIARMRAPRLLP